MAASIVQICKHCEKRFMVHPCHIKNGKNPACSKRCAYEFRKAQGPTRFWTKVQVGEKEACWPWVGGMHKKRGYGQTSLNRKGHNAHHVAYHLAVGPVPKGLVVRHKCDNPPCCNPAHLEIGTHADNARDRVERGRSTKGEHNNHARLTENQVRYIRTATDVRDCQLARQFGVSQTAIMYVRSGRTWKSVT